jgi:hypothetical protein
MAQMQRRALFIDDKSKTVIFSDEIEGSYMNLPEAMWLPALGYSKAFDGHIFVSGATESGKTYFIKKMVQNDRYKRNIVLFTNLESDDPSFRGLEDMKKFHSKNVDWDWIKSNDTNKILIFDDIQKNDDFKRYRDKMLEEARHKNTIVICVNHRLQDWYNTMVALNECRFVVTFPCSNKGNVFRYLKNEFEMDRNELNAILDRACSEGRYLIVHRFHPVCLASTESIFKL